MNESDWWKDKAFRMGDLAEKLREQIESIDSLAKKHLRNADAEIAELKALLRDAVASHNKHCICMACEYVRRPAEYRENKA